MTWPDVTAVLDALEAAAVPHWLAGGWGVDVLHGAQTRDHRDLDLLTDAGRHEACLRLLAALGCEVETDALPVRVELAAPGERWVDVHPVVFDASGHGVQGDPGGLHFDYAPDVLTTAPYAGRDVPCVSLAQQVVGHTGYAPRPQDLHDLALLRALG
jgi:lincosamide nucleotidyltransferase A/C/D/E